MWSLREQFILEVGEAARRGKAIPSWPAWMPRLAFSSKENSRKGDVLVVVFLRGAADGLNMIIPHGEEDYYRLRPTLAVSRPDDPRVEADKRALDLDGFFGLHPAMASLQEIWQAGHLAVVHASGTPDDSRSHFRSMELMERGVSTSGGPGSGWINRHLATLETGNPSPFRALGLGNRVPQSLQGTVPAAALRSIADFHLGGDIQLAERLQSTIRAMYQGSDSLHHVARESLQILATLRSLEAPSNPPRANPAYPSTEFGFAMQQAATLIHAEVGLEVAAIDLGGWDTHFAQGSIEGLMANLMSDLSQGLAAFYHALAGRRDQVTLVVMTEFGRRAQENASLGTDHGRGGIMLLLGGNVRGGRVHTRWPGLQEEQLVDPGDLAVTTDYRDVLAEICKHRLGNTALEELFPDFTPNFLGVVQELLR